MNRRQLLQGILGAALAPVFVKASNLMPVRSMPSGLIVWGDGVIDDTTALQAYINGERVLFARALKHVQALGSTFAFPLGKYRLTDSLVFSEKTRTVQGGGGVFSIDAAAPALIFPRDSKSELTIQNISVIAKQSQYALNFQYRDDESRDWVHFKGTLVTQAKAQSRTRTRPLVCGHKPSYLQRVRPSASQWA